MTELGAKMKVPGVDLAAELTEVPLFGTSVVRKVGAVSARPSVTFTQGS